MIQAVDEGVDLMGYVSWARSRKAQAIGTAIRCGKFCVGHCPR
jgi:beta-glucosidase/6-phospho-beta-glucosidase/beta-galactosidase